MLKLPRYFSGTYQKIKFHSKYLFFIFFTNQFFCIQPKKEEMFFFQTFSLLKEFCSFFLMPYQKFKNCPPMHIIHFYYTKLETRIKPSKVWSKFKEPHLKVSLGVGWYLDIFSRKYVIPNLFFLNHIFLLELHVLCIKIN